MKRILALVLIALAGCNATQQQVVRRPTAADDPTAECFKILATSPALIPLVPKLGSFTTLSPSMEMMANKDYPTPEEKQALSIWAQHRQNCFESGRYFRAQNAPPLFTLALEVQNSALLSAIAKLYGGDYNYSQFIAERGRIANEARAGFAAAQQSENQNNAAARVEALQRQQALAVDNANTMNILRSLQPAPAVNCTSNTFGGITRTQCR